jgi:serine protease Do
MIRVIANEGQIQHTASGTAWERFGLRTPLMFGVLSALMAGLLFAESRWSCAIAASASERLGNGREHDIRRDATVEAIEAIMPSVVNISTETIVEVRDPLEGVFRDFFGPTWGRQSQQSLGSGVIIDEDGYLLTNLHVVRRANRITVTLADGREFEAVHVVGTTKTDVALLKIITKSKEKFSAVRFAPDDDLLLGETVLALGNPFGLGGSVARGILSSKARRPPIQDESLDVADWLQTDAAINPGNSGGPLINLRGELIGINVAIFREGQGIGFAIPVKRISEALALMFTPERVKQLWFGATIESVKGKLTFREAQPGSPAERAGLQPGDVISRVNDKVPHNVFELNRELIAANDDDVRLSVQRDGTRKNVTLRLVPESTVFNAELIRKKIGLHVQPLTPDLAAAMRLPRAQGLVVSEIDRNGPAEKAQLRAGDLIQAVDGYAVDDIIEVGRLLYGKHKGAKSKLNVVLRRSSGNFVRLYSTTVDIIVQ